MREKILISSMDLLTDILLVFGVLLRLTHGGLENEE